MNDMRFMLDIKSRNMSDEIFQSVKGALRELGYIPNPKLIYEMMDKTDRELNSIRIRNIDELCFEDRLKRNDEERAERDSFRKTMFKTQMALRGYTKDENPYEETV